MVDASKPFFKPGGTLDPSSESYLVRQADEDLFDALRRREYVFLLDARQKGKSSLVARAIVRLKETGVRTVRIDLQRIGANVTPDQWYAGLLSAFGNELGLTKELFEFWAANQAIGPLARWIEALEAVVLRKVPGPIVVFIDEIDFVRALDFSTDEFFAGVRDCYNRRADQPQFGQLTFCLIGVATPGQLVRNPEITPFNIGTRIDLTDFTRAELAPYAVVLQSANRDGVKLLDRVFHWASGHPYLTQALCDDLSKLMRADVATVDRIVKERFLTLEARHKETNLVDCERRMLEPDLTAMTQDEQRSRVLDTYGHVLRGRLVPVRDDDPVVSTLRLAGTCIAKDGRLVPRNLVYANVFNEAWRRLSMPDAERRRQRAAAWKAGITTGAIASLIVISVGALGIYASNLARERSSLLTRSQALAAENERQTYVARMNLIESLSGSPVRKVELLRQTGNHRGKGWEWHRWNLLFNLQAKQWVTKSGLSLANLTTDGSLATVCSSDGNVNTLSYENGESWTLAWLGQLRWPLLLGYPMAKTKLFCERIKSLEERCGGHRIQPFEASPDGSSIVYYDPDRDTYCLAQAQGEPIVLYRGTERPHNLLGTFSYDGTKIALVTENNRLRCFDARSGRPLWGAPCKETIALSFSPDGSKIVLALNEETIPIYDATSGRPIRTLRGHFAPIRFACFSRSGKQLLSASQDGTARLWSVATGQTLRVFAGHGDILQSAFFLRDESKVITADPTGDVRLWDLNAPPPTQIVDQMSDEAHGLSFGDLDDRWIASAQNGEAVCFNPKSGLIDAKWPLNTLSSGTAVALSSDGTWAACFGPDNTVKRVDVLTLEVRDQWPGVKAQPGPIEISPLGDTIVAGFRDGSLLALRPRDSRVHRLVGHTRRIRSIAFEPKGILCATSSEDGSVCIWDVAKEKLVRTWRPEAGSAVVNARFSHDGQQLVCAVNNFYLAILSMHDESVRILKGHNHRVFGATYSPDDSRILSYSFDGTARLWDAKTGRELATMRHDSWVSSAKFSPDGERVVTTSADKTIRIWDGHFGDEYLSLRDHSQAVFDAAFTHDGKNIVSVSNDGTVRIWRSL